MVARTEWRLRFGTEMESFIGPDTPWQGQAGPESGTFCRLAVTDVYRATYLAKVPGRD